MKKLLLVLLLPSLAQAAPFLVSDPWPIGGAQPDTCVAVEGGANMPLTLIAVSGSKQIKHDLGGVAGGNHTYLITCANQWGASDPVNFTFAAGKPSAPAGLTIAP